MHKYSIWNRCRSNFTDREYFISHRDIDLASFLQRVCWVIRKNRAYCFRLRDRSNLWITSPEYNDVFITDFHILIFVHKHQKYVDGLRSAVCDIIRCAVCEMTRRAVCNMGWRAVYDTIGCAVCDMTRRAVCDMTGYACLWHDRMFCLSYDVLFLTRPDALFVIWNDMLFVTRQDVLFVIWQDVLCFDMTAV